MKVSNLKSFRLLTMYEKLSRGDIIRKKDLAEQFEISEKSVQRDIEDLRIYLAEQYEGGDEVTIEYDYAKDGYRLVKQEREFLTNDEIFAIAKVLLESRGFNKEELNRLIDKLLLQATPDARVNIRDLILKERFHYIPPLHGKTLINIIWEISGYIHNQERIKIGYQKMDGTIIEAHIEPLAIMFSEFYFYLIAWYADHMKNYPTVFRIDRISKIAGTKEKFVVPYKDRFNDGEFRKRVFYMYPGDLKKIKFEYNGPSVEAVLDKIPTAEIEKNDGNTYTIKAECYGKGIDMWLKSQGDYVRVLE